MNSKENTVISKLKFLLTLQWQTEMLYSLRRIRECMNCLKTNMVVDNHLGLPLLRGFSFNLSMDKNYIHDEVLGEISKLQHLHRWSLGIDT